MVLAWTEQLLVNRKRPLLAGSGPVVKRRQSNRGVDPIPADTICTLRSERAVMSEREISMLAFTYYKTGVFIAVAMTGFLTCCAHAPKTPKLDHRSGLNLAPIAET